MSAVWVAVVALFLLSEHKFIRTVYEIYPHRIVRLVAAVAGVEAHGQEDVKEQELAGTKPRGEPSSQSLAD